MTHQESPEPEDLTPELPPYVPSGIILIGPDYVLDAQILMALGALIRNASHVDHTLRIIYGALVGSTYALVTAGGQMTSWLTTECTALVKARDGISEEQRSEALRYLATISELSGQRNRVVHDIWASSNDGPVLVRSRRGTDRLTIGTVTLNEIIQCGQGLIMAGANLHRWVHKVLGPDTFSAMRRT